MASSTSIRVTKRNGNKEPLNLDKFHKVVYYACEGITGVSSSEVEIRSHVQFYDGIKTSDIQETLIKSAGDLISEDTPGYQYVGGRLINYHIRKEVYGKFEPDHLYDIVVRNIERGFYDAEILNKFTRDEWDQLNSFIKHERDETLTYAAMEQFRGKYLVQNRVTKEIFETPQICYILIAAILFADYPENSGGKSRMSWIKDYYEAISTFDISLPTPIMAGLRTSQKQFSSCVLIETDDSLDSINATASAIVKYVSQKAGIGINAGKIRAIGSSIRKGDAYHTGLIPFLKYFQSAVASCNQGGIRRGAATVSLPCWHYEIEDMIVLKNNKGTEETRVRHMDYNIQFNKLMYERLISGGNITLFSPHEIPGLYDSFFENNDEFKKIYELAENNPKIRKKTIKALDLFTLFMEERKNTGRIYLMNVDNVNSHGSFHPELAPIKQSNLCQEITLPCRPLNDIYDEAGRIQLCTLSAINWGNIKEPKDFERVCRLAVRGLDSLLDYQNYLLPAARLATEDHRPLGIGIINFANWLAKQGLTYQHIDTDGLSVVDEWAEAWSYYLIRESIELAKEKGACVAVNETKYADGIVPIDTRKLDIDQLVPHVERMDWKSIRSDLQTYGIRNATLMALMPSESSSQVSNSTNGIEPPRAFVSVKQSRDGVLKQVVPDYRRLKNKYDLLWNQKSPVGYLKIAAVLQKYIDQSISINTSYHPKYYADGKIPMSELLQHMLMFYKYGGKNLYYFNTNDQSGEIIDDDDDTDSLGQELLAADDEDDCDGCKI